MADTTTSVKIISLNELKNRMKDGNKPVVVNVLTEQFYKEHNGERIPGSLWIPLNEVEQTFPKKFSKEEEIITYCGGPKCPQSKQAAEKLINLGFKNVRAFEGGLEEWKNAGLQLENKLEKGKGESSQECCGS